jgi:hypothetical protein
MKEAVVAYFEEPSRHIPGGNEETTKEDLSYNTQCPG